MIAPLLLLLAAPAQAFPNYAVLYKSKYGYLPSCLACHDQDSWQPNKYGKEFRAAGRNLNAFDAIAAKDADGDGIKNLEEILAKANPGDPQSTPKHPGDWLNEAGIHPPQKLLKAAFDGASTFKVKEVTLTKDQDAALSKKWGAALPDESRYSVVFDAMRDKEKAGAGTYLSVDLPGAKGASLLFVASAKPGVLSFLKLIEYDGTGSLKNVWTPLVGKTREELLKDESIKGPKDEIAAFKNAIARGLLVIESTWDQ
jgi:hypothetical protein